MIISNWNSCVLATNLIIKLKVIRYSENWIRWEVFPGMVQPFIENAIWHGVRGLQFRKGFIKVDFFRERKRFASMYDNG